MRKLILIFSILIVSGAFAYESKSFKTNYDFKQNKKTHEDHELIKERQEKARENMEQKFKADEILEKEKQEAKEPQINPEDDYANDEGSVD